MFGSSKNEQFHLIMCTTICLSLLSIISLLLLNPVGFKDRAHQSNKRIIFRKETPGNLQTSLWNEDLTIEKINTRNLSDEKVKIQPSLYKRQLDVKNRTYILIWRRPWGIKTEGSWYGIDNMGKCVITYDRNKLKDAALVFFHYTGLDEEKMPWKHYRDPEQVFVIYSGESPSYVFNVEKRRETMKKFDGGFINWTLSYRSDADVQMLYVSQHSQSIRSKLERGKIEVDNLLSKKRRVALWIVSNCDIMRGSRLRMEYAESLIKAGLPLDRYGRCFNNKEEFNDLKFEDLQSYKFYLAFENAHYCKDYITEKFWRNAIVSGRVPVVWGPSKEDVARAAPLGSFIHTDDFDSPQSLVDYLMYLNSNDTAYREYFKWIEEPSDATENLLTKYEISGFKHLCNRVLSNPTPKTVKSVSDFMFEKEKNPECLQT